MYLGLRRKIEENRFNKKALKENKMSNKSNDIATQFAAPLFTFAGDAFDTDFDIGLLSEYLLDDEREQDDNNNDNNNLNINNNMNNNVPYSNNNNIYNKQAFQLNSNSAINIPPFAGFGSEGLHSLISKQCCLLFNILCMST